MQHDISKRIISVLNLYRRYLVLIPGLMVPVFGLNTYFVGESTINREVTLWYQSLVQSSGDTAAIVDFQQRSGGTDLRSAWEEHDSWTFSGSDSWKQLPSGTFDVLLSGV
jgi:hypothetical protein